MACVNLLIYAVKTNILVNNSSDTLIKILNSYQKKKSTKTLVDRSILLIVEYVSWNLNSKPPKSFLDRHFQSFFNKLLLPCTIFLPLT